MENNNELLQELIKTGIDEFKKNQNKETDEDNTINDTKETLIEHKKSIAKKYVEKNINNPILQATWIVEDYLVSEGFWDKIKDKLFYEKLLEKSDFETETIQQIKQLRADLEKSKTESELTILEENFSNKQQNNDEIVEEKTNEEKKENIDNEENIKQKIQSELNQYNNCPLTAEMIIISAKEHQVPIEYIMAIMKNDSHYWTAGVWARTHNPGNVWNTDDWSTKDRATREKGVDAVAKNLARRIKEYQNIYGNRMPTIRELANNQWPDKKGFIANQWNYKKNNKERFWAYMTDKTGWNSVQKISNQLAQNIFNQDEYKLVA